MDKRAEQKRAYKDNPPPSGIYKITNTANGKIFLGSALNVPGKLNGAKFTLQQGGHFNAALQAEWKQFGPEAFTFEVLDVLKPAIGETEVKRDELEALEAMWLEKLQPYGERGYNQKKS
jgi:hypothetical protein